MPKSKKRGDLIQGTLDLLVLQVLSAGPMHGYAIAAQIHERSDEVLRIEEGSLYPALYRLEAKGVMSAKWGTTGSGRDAKFYELTRTGRRQLEAETESWIRLSTAVGKVIGTVGQEG